MEINRPVHILEKIENFSDYEFIDNDTAILLTFDVQPFAQVKYDLSISKVENIEIVEPNKVKVHSLIAYNSDPKNMSYNARIIYLYKDKYYIQFYFENERVVVYTFNINDLNFERE